MASVAGVRKGVAEETKGWVDEKISQDMKGAGAVRAGHKPAAGGVAGPMIHKDEFYVSPERRKALGIEDHEEVTWVRNPKTWESIEMADSLDKFLWDGDGHRVIQKGGVDGAWIKNGDVVMCVRPKYEIEARDAELNANVRRDYGSGESTSHKLNRDAGGRPEFRKEALEPEDVYESSQAARSEGLVGTQGAGSTAGQDWPDVVRQKGEAGFEAEQAYYRSNARHSDERNREVMGKNAVQDPHQPRVGKVHAMGATFDAKGKIVR
jgi:hypothetical protein